MRAGALAAIGAIVVLTGLSACESGGQPADLPTDTVTATAGATASTRPTEPAPPSATGAARSTAPGVAGSASSSASTTPSGASGPTAEPTTASVTTAEPSASASEHSKAGAVAAANAYIRAVDHAYATGDVAPLKKLTAPDCHCAGMISAIRNAKEAGYTWTGGRISILVSDAGADTDDGGHSYTIHVLAAISDLHTVDPHGKPFDNPKEVLGSGPGTPRADERVTVDWRDSHWLVSHFIIKDLS